MHLRLLSRLVSLGALCSWPALGILVGKASEAATLVITEVSAAAQTTLADEDGEYPDWVEVFNASPTAMDLTGWFLTDSPATLNRWRFPSTNLVAGQRLVVFASGKDRAVSGAPLHTSFSLSADGEEVALVAAGGRTIVSELKFPAQRPGLSYGVSEPLGSLQTNMFLPPRWAAEPELFARRGAQTPSEIRGRLPARREFTQGRLGAPSRTEGMTKNASAGALILP